MARLLPHRDGRRGEIRVGEATYGNRNVSRKALALPIDGRATSGTKMKRQQVAAFGLPRPCRGLARDGDLLAAEARLVADHRTGATLTLQAVAHGDPRRLALERQLKLPAAAGGAPAGHGSTPLCRAGEHRAAGAGREAANAERRKSKPSVPQAGRVADGPFRRRVRRRPARPTPTDG